MSYDVPTIAAIMEMASLSARMRLIESAFDKRDYGFLNAVIEVSGLECINRAVPSEGGGSRTLFEMAHPLETAVVSDDRELFDWVIDKGIALSGSWVAPPEGQNVRVLRFPALEHAFALGRREMVPALLKMVSDDASCNFFLDAAQSSAAFGSRNKFSITRPAGTTPLTCALVNGWDDLVGQFLPGTSKTFEYDLMMAIDNGSDHVDAIAAKLGALEFPNRTHHLVGHLHQPRREQYFDALVRAEVPVYFKAGVVEISFLGSIGTREGCAYLLDNKAVCDKILSCGLDPLHNMLGAAINAHRIDIVEWLINERGADPNYALSESKDRRSGFVKPPVFSCAGEMLDYLVGAGADINALHDSLGTPLIDAIKNDSSKVEQLIRLGADTAIKHNGRSALQLAKSDSVREIIRSSRTSASIAGSIKSASADAAIVSGSRSSLTPL